MSAAALTAAGEVVGWSAWPHDPYYTPVVGLFVAGRLTACGPCRLPAPATSARETPPPASMRPLGFLRRARLRAAPPSSRSAPSAPEPVRLEGPAEPCWFGFPLPPEIAGRLREGDPAVRLERLEDGAPVPLAGSHVRGRPQGPRPVEALLDPTPPRAARPRDGFLGFLATPPRRQLQAVFLEYLRRLPDAQACAHYLPRLEAGECDVLGVRDEILASEEFGRRRIGYGAHLGSAFTSPLWRRLATLPAAGPPLRPPARLQVDAFAETDGARFLAALAQALGRPPFEGVEAPASPEARRAFARAQLREAAARGVYLEVV